MRRIFNDETIGDSYRIIYELHDIKTDTENATSDEIIDILRKILSIYGGGGVGLENFTPKEKLKASLIVNLKQRMKYEPQDKTTNTELKK